MSPRKDKNHQGRLCFTSTAFITGHTGFIETVCKEGSRFTELAWLKGGLNSQNYSHSHIVFMSCVFFKYRMDMVKHIGGCHCGAVRFEVWSSPDLHVFHCKYAIFNKIKTGKLLFNEHVKMLTKSMLDHVYINISQKITQMFFFSVVAFAQRNKTIISLFQKINSDSYR